MWKLIACSERSGWYGVDRAWKYELVSCEGLGQSSVLMYAMIKGDIPVS